MRIQLVGFVIGLGGIGLLHQLSRILYVLFFLSFNLLDLLADGVQILGLFVVSLITVAAIAAAPPEQVLPRIDGGKLRIAAGQNHVGSVTSLATGFGIFLGIERPEPVLIIAVRLFDAGGGTPISLVAG